MMENHGLIPSHSYNINMKKQTTMQELQPGDRFYFASDGKRIVYQVTTCRKYNLVTNSGAKRWQYDRPADADRAGIFLRNTKELS